MGEFPHAVMVAQRRDLQLEDQQGDDDREYPVAERLDAVQPQLSSRKAFQQTHAPH